MRDARFSVEISARGDSPDVLVLENPEEVAWQVALLVRSVVRDLPGAKLGLCTGRTSAAMYAALTEMHGRGEVDFSGVTTFNLDEYCDEPPESSRSFRHYMQVRFFDHVNIEPSCVHFPACGERGPEEFERKIAAIGGIDLLLLGIGVNGHIAFNEPGTPFHSRAHVTDLAESTLAENFSDPTTAGQYTVPRSAVSMGIATILEARKIVLMATGRKKADAIRRALLLPASIKCPASALQSHANTIFVLDKDAAAELTDQK